MAAVPAYIALLCLVVFLANHLYLMDQLSVVEGVEAGGWQRRLLFATERLHGVEMLKQEETGIGVGGAEAEHTLVLRRIRIDVLVERVDIRTLQLTAVIVLLVAFLAQRLPHSVEEVGEIFLHGIGLEGTLALLVLVGHHTRREQVGDERAGAVHDLVLGVEVEFRTDARGIEPQRSLEYIAGTPVDGFLLHGAVLLP